MEERVPNDEGFEMCHSHAMTISSESSRTTMTDGSESSGSRRRAKKNSPAIIFIDEINSITLIF